MSTSQGTLNILPKDIRVLLYTRYNCLVFFLRLNKFYKQETTPLLIRHRLTKPITIDEVRLLLIRIDDVLVTHPRIINYSYEEHSNRIARRLRRMELDIETDTCHRHLCLFPSCMHARPRIDYILRVYIKQWTHIDFQCTIGPHYDNYWSVRTINTKNPIEFGDIHTWNHPNTSVIVTREVYNNIMHHRGVQHISKKQAKKHTHKFKPL